MNERQRATILCVGRGVIGLELLLRPGRMGASWIGRPARRTGPQVPLRAAGARDLALAVGTLTALWQHAPVGGWLAAGVLADAADLTASLAAGDQLPALGRFGVPLLAGAAMVEGALLTRALRS